MFKEQLKLLRNQKHLSQAQLAKEIGVSSSTIAMWETGKREPNFETLNDLSEIFDKRIDYILGYSKDAPSPKMTEEDVEQLGRWESEAQFHEAMLAYLRLDEFGKAAVEGLIKAEMQRCREQNSLLPEQDFALRIRLRKEEVE